MKRKTPPIGKFKDLSEDTQMVMRMVILSSPQIQAAQKDFGFDDDKMVDTCIVLIEAGLMVIKYNPSTDLFSLDFPYGFPEVGTA